MAAAPAMTAKDELEGLQLEELRDLKRIRDERKAAEAKRLEDEKAGADRVMVYSIFKDYHLGKSAQRTVPVVMHDGKARYLPDSNYKHAHHQWRLHRLWMSKADLRDARTNARGAYGQEFVEALPTKDGDPLAMDLKTMLKTPKGEAFINRMKYNDEQVMWKPPITPLEVRNEIDALETGKLKPPAIGAPSPF